MNAMKIFLAASVNPFDVKAALLAGHAQHPVIIHFPMALFIASAFFGLLAVWRKQPVFATVAYYNLLGAALTVPFGKRHRPGGVAMAARRRGSQRQPTPAYDLRADFGVPNLLSLLDALAPPCERHPASDRLFRSNVARADGDHAHWTSWWNPQRR
jgi:hypothetical protein